MEAIEALPSRPCERKPVDIEKIHVLGDREAFLKAIDKDNYQIKCALGDFIDDLDEIFTYYVSTASAIGDDRVQSLKRLSPKLRYRSFLWLPEEIWRSKLVPYHLKVF